MNAFTRRHLVIDERSAPPEEEGVIQPFLLDEASSTPSASWMDQAGWSAQINRESLMLSLSQVTAAALLPPLIDLPTGLDLLHYAVDLHTRLDALFLREVTLYLENNWESLGWQRVDAHTFLCVIGAGVAACLQTAPGAEQLSLRYNSDLANELFHAGRAIDLPRSRLFLQTTLYEKINVLLAQARSNCWNWL